MMRVLVVDGRFSSTTRYSSAWIGLACFKLARRRAPAEAASDLENRLRTGALGYGDLKKALFEQYWNHFAAARIRRAELAAHLDYVNQVLREGATKARAVAQVVLQRAKVACGLE